MGSRSYDSLGRITRSTDSSGGDVRYTYDNAGNVITKTEVRDSSTNLVTQYSYDAFNRLKTVTSPKGETTSYNYLATGELSLITDPKGKTSSFTYDPLGRVISKTDPLGKVRQFSYDGNGNVVSEIDPNGNLKSYQYDQLNQLITKTLPDNVYQYAYDVRGNMIAASNNSSQISFVVDLASRVLSTTIAGIGAMNLPAMTTNYSYNANNSRTSMTDPLRGVTNYSYNQANQLVSLVNPLGENFGFGFDGQNRLTQVSRPGSVSTYSYGTSNYLNQILHQSSGQTVSFFTFSRDQLGQITGVSSSLANNSYSYDADNFLSQSSSSTGNNETYTYDGLGNRVTDQNGNYIYDSTGELLLQDYNYTYQYDNNGNLISKFSKTSANAVQYTYSSENQLIGVDYYAAVPGSPNKSVRYAYDALGRRLEKRVYDYSSPSDISKTFTRHYVYDNQEIIVEMDGSNQVLARYTHSSLGTDDVLSVNVTATGVSEKLAANVGSYFYLKDHLGSIRDITDSSGNVVQRYLYGSFGTIVDIKDNSGKSIQANPVLSTSYGFTGREYDKETGVYNYRARYYDPNVGRFLQQDPNPGNVNLPITVTNRYTYVGNQPINILDPSGKDFWDVLIAIAVVAAVIYTGGMAGAFVGEFVGGAVGGGVAGGIAGGIVGAITGAAVGAVVGGTIGGVGYSLIGRDFGQRFTQFAILGAEWGGIAGGITGGISGFKANAGSVYDYFYHQINLAKTNPLKYFFDLGYQSDTKADFLFGPGNGFASPSLGGTPVLIGLSYGLGDPKQSENQ